MHSIIDSLKSFLLEWYRFVWTKLIRDQLLVRIFTLLRDQPHSLQRFQADACALIAAAGSASKGGTSDQKDSKDQNANADSHHSASTESQGCIWIHAASAGELECVWSLAEALARETASTSARFVLTTFSPSGLGPVRKLRKSLEALGATVTYAGFSPWEGEWMEAIEKVRPTAFVTAKYEAWPELWIALTIKHIPLAIVGARVRRSLRVASWLCQVFTGKLPSLLLLASNAEEGERLVIELKQAGWLESAEIVETGDPRWDRVAQQSKVGNPRASELFQLFRDAPRPWGVLGSVWREDLKIWGQLLSETKGTLWIVPHRVEEEAILLIEEELRIHGISFVRSKELGSTPRSLPQAILVNEMGFLLELYPKADWAFVGGGFTHGIHSTIEPAIHGLPLAAGPKNAHLFPEVQLLRSWGQLALIDHHEALGRWVQSYPGNRTVSDGLGAQTARLGEMKESWKQKASMQLGATERVMVALRAKLQRSLQ